LFLLDILPRAFLVNLDDLLLLDFKWDLNLADHVFAPDPLFQLLDRLQVVLLLLGLRLLQVLVIDRLLRDPKVSLVNGEGWLALLLHLMHVLEDLNSAITVIFKDTNTYNSS
jgi:hypothetical protein